MYLICRRNVLVDWHAGLSALCSLQGSMQGHNHLLGLHSTATNSCCPHRFATLSE